MSPRKRSKPNPPLPAQPGPAVAGDGSDAAAGPGPGAAAGESGPGPGPPAGTALGAPIGSSRARTWGGRAGGRLSATMPSRTANLGDMMSLLRSSTTLQPPAPTPTLGSASATASASAPAPTPPAVSGNTSTTRRAPPTSASSSLAAAFIPPSTNTTAPKSVLRKSPSLQDMPPPKRGESDASTSSATTSKTAASSSKTAPKPNQVRKARSWYGAWPRKSQASTQVAHDTVMGGTLRPDTVPDFKRFDTRKSPTPSIHQSDAMSVKTLPKISETESQQPTSNLPGDEAPPPTQDDAQKDIDMPDAQPDSKGDGNTTSKPNKDLKGATDAPVGEPQARPSSSAGWLGGWFGRSPAPESTTDALKSPANPSSSPAPRRHTDAGTRPPHPPGGVAPTVADTPSKAETPKSLKPRASTSWFGLWTTAEEPSADETDAAAAGGEAADETRREDDAKTDQPLMMQDAPAPAQPENRPAAGSTWAFWSRDTGAAHDHKAANLSETDPGELAVKGDGSESSPKRSLGVEVRDSPAPNKSPPKPSKGAAAKAAISSKKHKRTRTQSIESDESPSRPGTPRLDSPTKAAPDNATSATSAEAPTTNLLLPSFRSTYRMKENPSIIQQIAQLLLRTQQPPANHVFLTQDLPRVKKAVAIGVHGLFPATFLRPMLGQPTGTSIRFMNHCAEAIRRWAEDHGCGDLEIEKVALEGEGKIGERVDDLWKLLLNWIEHIRDADLIVLACHSQGVPVGIMLIAKLIDLGIISNARVGICAMAGVSLGPFPDYKNNFGMLMGSAAELWQFADPDSEVSRRYEKALETVIDFGGRVTFVGSIDDQLVPMESAVHSAASHPYIYRAVFIDGRVNPPDFMSHLVGFALKLRNLGISDHDLIRELSLPLAGSLTGGGHSTLYDDDQVYDLAIAHTLETTSVSGAPFRLRKEGGLGSANPYVLPWTLRGLLEEGFVKTELYQETNELLKQFDEWKPITKPLKDVKYRLEAVRSKL